MRRNGAVAREAVTREPDTEPWRGGGDIGCGGCDRGATGTTSTWSGVVQPRHRCCADDRHGVRGRWDLRGIDLDRGGGDRAVDRDIVGSTCPVAVGCDGHRSFGDRAAKRIGLVIKLDSSKFVVRTNLQHIPGLGACFGVINAGHPVIRDHRIDKSVRDYREQHRRNHHIEFGSGAGDCRSDRRPGDAARRGAVRDRSRHRADRRRRSVDRAGGGGAGRSHRPDASTVRPGSTTNQAVARGGQPDTATHVRHHDSRFGWVSRLVVTDRRLRVARADGIHGRARRHDGRFR